MADVVLPVAIKACVAAMVTNFMQTSTVIVGAELMFSVRIIPDVFVASTHCWSVISLVYRLHSQTINNYIETWS